MTTNISMNTMPINMTMTMSEEERQAAMSLYFLASPSPSPTTNNNTLDVHSAAATLKSLRLADLSSFTVSTSTAKPRRKSKTKLQRRSNFADVRKKSARLEEKSNLDLHDNDHDEEHDELVDVDMEEVEGGRLRRKRRGNYARYRSKSCGVAQTSLSSSSSSGVSPALKRRRVSLVSAISEPAMHLAAASASGVSYLGARRKGSSASNSGGMSLAYDPEQRARAVARYLEKRKHRDWRKKIKYSVRKTFADSRLRVKGRFVSKEDEQALLAALAISV